MFSKERWEDLCETAASDLAEIEGIGLGPDFFLRVYDSSASFTFSSD